MAGVYSITSPSGKSYIGSAINFDKRWAMHLWHLRRGSHNNRALQAAFFKYTESKLTFKKLLICSPENVLFYEQRALDFLKPEYNVCKVAGSTLGIKYSEAAKANLRAAQTPERRAAKSKILTGIVRSPETCLKISQAKKGKVRGPVSEATKLKLSISNLGKVRTEQQRANNSVAQLGLLKGVKKPEGFGAKIALTLSKPVQCVDTGMFFPSSKAAGQWCIDTNLTNSPGARGMITWSVKTGKLAYGLQWIRGSK